MLHSIDLGEDEGGSESDPTDIPPRSTLGKLKSKLYSLPNKLTSSTTPALAAATESAAECSPSLDRSRVRIWPTNLEVVDEDVGKGVTSGQGSGGDQPGGYISAEVSGRV